MSKIISVYIEKEFSVQLSEEENGIGRIVFAERAFGVTRELNRYPFPSPSAALPMYQMICEAVRRLSSN